MSDIPTYLSHVLTVRKINEKFDGLGSGSLPPGGSTGEVLTKQSSADGDATWEPLILTGGSA